MKIFIAPTFFGSQRRTSFMLSFEAPIKKEKFARDFFSPNRNFFFNKSCVNVCGEVLGISIKEVIPPATAALLSE